MTIASTQETLAVGTLAVGSRIADRYEIRKLLGVGGMGSVYRVYDRELDEEVALKILRPEHAATPDALVRFRREVKLARRVTHPNIARTYDFGEYLGVRYLTMELIVGERPRAPLPIAELLRVAWEISQGLAAAHAAGVVHRDLKPDNILIAGDRVVITDFGIAHADNLEDAMRTQGNVMGTPAYIAPEQLEGAVVDGRADVYALGIVMYELAAGKLPFDGETATAIALARLTREPNPLLVPGLPEGLVRLVMSALARRRDERPDAHTVAARLGELRGGGAARGDTSLRIADFALPASARRTVLVAKLDADAATQGLAADLATAIADALVGEPAIVVVRDGTAETAIEVTTRASGDRVRVRLRSSCNAEPTWAERLDGSLSDPFGLEDAVVGVVGKELRKRLDERSGPQGPLLERYEAARTMMMGGPVRGRASITMFEQLLDLEPDNAWFASALALAIQRVALQTGADDARAFARAEELALRALDRDPANGQAYHAIASIRSVRGEHAESLAAARETLRRAPMMPEPQLMIGRLLCWTNRVAEGLQRLELAARLDRVTYDAAEEKLRVLALLGERERALGELAALEQRHRHAGMLARLRLFCWWQERPFVEETHSQLGEMSSGGSWELAKPALEHWLAGDLGAMRAATQQAMDRLIHPRVIPRQRAFMYEIAVEMFMVCNDRESALRYLADAVALPAFMNLLWLDRCPSLAPLRDHPELARARAVVAERAARLFT